MSRYVTITATRYHDFSCGHRVVGHEGKCRHLHGHNYRAHFTVEGPQDAVGRTLDFGVMKGTLCAWLEDNWDHKMLLWSQDPFLDEVRRLSDADWEQLGVVPVPFNPTAENMAHHLLVQVGPALLDTVGATCLLTHVRLEETRKCSAAAELRR